MTAGSVMTATMRVGTAHRGQRSDVRRQREALSLEPSEPGPQPPGAARVPAVVARHEIVRTIAIAVAAADTVLVMTEATLTCASDYVE